jgi:hypothetical protein
LAERLDGPSGDFNPNISLQMTLGMFATTPQWLALPFCEAVSATQVVERGAEWEQHDALMIEDVRAVDSPKRLNQKKAQRQLIGGFGLSEGDQALVRQRLLCGCC